MRRAALVLLVLSQVLGSACAGTSSGSDAGPRDTGGDTLPDGQVPSGNDTDSDGLCDDTELRHGTSITDPDTDDDGFPDLVEVSFDSDPLAPASPDRDHVYYLREVPTSTVQAVAEVVLRGRGNTFLGAIQPLDAYDRDELLATDFLTGVEAVLASPMDHVTAIEGDRFSRVNGNTRLVWNANFAFGGHEARRCIRAFPFAFEIKRDEDSAFVQSDQDLLVIQPDAELDIVEWCSTLDGCI